MGDKSVVPNLKLMATGKEEASTLGRLHALWTLEGLHEINREIINVALNDADAQIRRAAIWLSEPYIGRDDNEMVSKIGSLKNDVNSDVKVQILTSMGESKNELAKKIVQDILTENSDNQMLKGTKVSIDRNRDAKVYGIKLATFNIPDRKLITEGLGIYQSMCTPCHGEGGKGLPTNAAPALKGAKHINHEKDYAIRILLHGLKGSIEGKTYPSEMVSMKDNSDEWIASVLSYIRYEFVGGNLWLASGRQSPVIQPEEVKKVRSMYGKSRKSWTIEELEKELMPVSQTVKRN